MFSILTGSPLELNISIVEANIVPVPPRRDDVDDQVLSIGQDGDFEVTPVVCLRGAVVLPAAHGLGTSFQGVAGRSAGCFSAAAGTASRMSPWNSMLECVPGGSGRRP